MIPKTVDTSVICTWLGIPPDQWPPDHYTLLGLPSGEQDTDRIERQVQQRLEQVRRYQLASPEAATEAMNRIAQAFVCLTDPQARRTYDQSLFGAAGLPALQTPTALPSAITPATSEQVAAETAVDPEFLALVEEEVQAAPLPILTPLTEKDRAAEEEAERKVKAPARSRRGLETRQAIYHQIVQTRAMLRLWARAGRHIGNNRRRLSRPSEARDLIDVMTSIRDRVRDFPGLLGEAGQPGYLVIALARQPAIVPTFQTLLPSQREALTRDWNAGQKALKEHQDFLRHEARSLRRKTLLGKAVRAVRIFLNEHPAGWLIVLGLLALAIAVLRQLFV
jgi:hypothetical protein